MYDVFVDGAWAVSRGAPDNVLSWIAEKTASDDPAKVEFIGNNIRI